MTTAYERVVDAFRAHGLIVIERGTHTASAQAPGHSPADRSVSIRGIEGQVLIHSHSDDTATVLDAVGLTMPDLFDSPQGATYSYDDGRIVRRTPAKKFSQTGNTQGRSLFRASRLADVDTVFLVEGEKDVLAIESLGGTATCNAMGAGKLHLFDLTPLHGKKVVIVRDMDEIGESHARQALSLLEGRAEVTLVRPAVGKDAADHIVNGYGLQDFPPVTPPMPEGPRRLSDAVADWWTWLDAPPSQVRIFPTPWVRLNEVIGGGQHPKRVYIVAGRPGGGKTIGLLNLAHHMAENGHRALVFSLEMPELEMVSRVMSAGAEANYGRITRRELDQWDRRKLELFHRGGRIDNTDLWLMDHSTLTIEDIRAIARQMKASTGLDGVFIDYIGLITATKGHRDRRESLGHIMKEAVKMSKELDLAVTIASQLNRGPDQSNRPPILSDLRETGDIEQDCDVALLLHHPQMDGIPTGEVEIIVAKNRTGPRDTTITLPWRPNYAKIGA
ncbi:DnaB-like helicase C-terminal domain-containing protein [Nocardia pseudobrasiliensis]|uniref:Toprim domain-containing protein n=1 Tax=Nocardia pseudobrasiliensis TaxID=45979 RepID=A0A370I6I1_9NOCA|nr:DnaB-like helicase C-terminal domain-containing protein [Nocardia pseudobrasiliensis]RDI65711.1 Toprim domain-containing protein [Nocardia pseudobrasiliensis]